MLYYLNFEKRQNNKLKGQNVLDENVLVVGILTPSAASSSFPPKTCELSLAETAVLKIIQKK